MGGSDYDFIGWEHSFSCGNQRDVFEFFARLAGWNKAVAYYSSSGSFSTANCRPTKDRIPWTSEHWMPDNRVKPSNLTWEKVLVLRREHNEWYEDSGSVARFTQMLRKPPRSKPQQLNYDGTAPHGFNVWAKSKKPCKGSNVANASHALLFGQKVQKNSKSEQQECVAVDVKGDCFDQGGPHWMVQESSYHDSDGSSAGSSTKLQHHPSTALHLLRAELLAFNYAHILADALFMLRRDLKDSGLGSTGPDTAKVNHLMKTYRHELEKLQQPLPAEPWFCAPWECALKPRCFTDYRPQHNPRQSLSGIVLGTHRGWRRETVEEHENYIPFGYLDRRVYFKAQGGNRQLHLLVEGVRANAIKVFGRFFGESIRHCQFYLDANIDLQAMSSILAYPNGQSRKEDVSVNAYNPSSTRFLIQANQRNYSAEDDCVW
eukprot:CAMPEP_0170072872 /NCGR_PEP_ID=MMETSP0019_2-20121128/10412_1 /TAXON_ID=98059 /ORGANISM="Dinobryon sp., Strain UTEXLB2267" /LENGTH=430 /DNA_ID=CAMNT_0010282081 /DNA_START=484 /DNA_END=1773 /DNA_ORIENTATION=+